MSEQITVEGVGKLTRQLKKVDAELPKEVKTINRRSAETVAAETRSRAPKRKGKLAASVRAGATLKAGTVRIGSKAVPYAAPIHFGWPAHNIVPNPFGYEALDARRPEVFDDYERSIKALCLRVFGDA